MPNKTAKNRKRFRFNLNAKLKSMGRTARQIKRIAKRKALRALP